MLADSLRALLSCPVCRRLLSAPSTLACGHSLCSSHAIRCPCSHTQQQHSNARLDVLLNNIIALLEDPPDDSSFEKVLLHELTCPVCFSLLYEPITTPCQHTFCTRCLHRSLDHSIACPVCRESIQGTKKNHTVSSIILNLFPVQYKERTQAIEAEAQDARLDTPIFVCHLSFPGTPTVLHLFEPRYRLMLRRCLESPTPRFGMVMSPKPGSGTPQVEYGTMLEIRGVQMLPDGRSIVETWGTYRFRVMERGVLDGYMVGRIERIEDHPDDVFDPQASPSNSELMQACRTFLDRLQRGTAPWVVQRLNNAYGSIPSDPASFSFWVALVLPIDEYEKAKLLPIRSARMRLLMVTHWIEQLNNNWYALSYLSGWWGAGMAVASGLLVYALLLIWP